MKEFDIEKAKAGAPVCTRNGNPVRIICWDAKDPNFPIVALVDSDDVETVENYTDDGFWLKDKTDNELNLMMASVKREGWVNIFGKKGLNSCGGFIYPSIERAKEDGEQCEEYITTTHIAWEE